MSSHSPNMPWDAVRGPIVDALPGFLATQRWFADKHRQVISAELVELTALQDSDAWVLLTIVKIRFIDGPSTSYFVPLTMQPRGSRPGSYLCEATVRGFDYDILDAIGQPAFHRWLLHAIHVDLDFDAEHGRIECRSETGFRLPPGELSGKPSGAEQSNSSILFGDSLIAKVYRRISSGINPDVEVGKFLTRNTKFTQTPQLLGSINYLGNDGSSTLVMVQEQLTNPVDCWSKLLESLERSDWATAEIGSSLGSVTAHLHLALASRSELPDFAPAVATRANIDTWKSALNAGIDRVSSELAGRLGQLDSSGRELAGSFLAATPELRQRGEGFKRLLGLPLIRVHGDYHLGQVLRLPDGSLIIVDFEGEPQRPIHERRAKTSPLKDVTGMLRSFSYARGAAFAAAGERWQTSLMEWEQRQRRHFLAAYRGAIAFSGLPLIPGDPEALDVAITAWEIDKALYEVSYELSSRPSWLWLPLSSLVKFG